MYKDPINEIDAEVLLEELKSINGKQIGRSDLQTLREIFSQTNYIGLRDRIAATLVEAEDEDFYPCLISKIKDVIHTRYVSNLIYAASSYNCSEDIQLFIDLVILKSDMCLADAMGVIEVMEDINEKERQYAINKLTAYLDTLNKSSSKYEDVTIVISFLSSL